ncbi:MAG TPA: hypothetical protein VFE38_09200 [Edaphobacter sp.]|nr:hypothetical protein [Edaphobacter sp.]
MRTLTISKVRLALVAVLAAFLAQPALKAQVPETVAVANIPFAFQIDSQQMPAGKYTFDVRGPNLLQISGNSGSAIMAVYWDSAKKPSSIGSIGFNRYGNRYFLRNVHFRGSDYFLASSTSSAERRMQLQIVASNGNHSSDGASNVKVATLVTPGKPNK